MNSIIWKSWSKMWDSLFLSLMILFLLIFLLGLPFLSNSEATWLTVTFIQVLWTVGSPLSFFIRRQAFLLFLVMSVFSMRSLHFLVLSSPSCIVRFSPAVIVSLLNGSFLNRSWYISISFSVSLFRPGMYFSLQPRGMCCLDIFLTLIANIS